MREIKFRAKSGTQWRYGDLYHNERGELVIYEPKTSGRTLDSGAVDGWRIKVDPETVGQYTGLCDANGQDIYEGDVVAFGDFRKAHDIENEYWHDVVKWDNKHARFILDTLFFDDVFSNELLIIGNVHDNPELLERES